MVFDEIVEMVEMVDVVAADALLLVIVVELMLVVDNGPVLIVDSLEVATEMVSATVALTSLSVQMMKYG